MSSDQEPGPSRTRIGTAVVLGGSVAGMLAARVLAGHADTVTIIERDATADDAAPRHGVPQGTQVHALLAGGARQLERWFPGFTERAVAAGAVLATADRTVMYVGGVPKIQGARLDTLTATRPFIEGRIRAELLKLPNVKIVTGRVTGLAFDATAVTAVAYESGGVDGREPADLVVDALGRASKVSDWLESAGWERPPMTRLPIGLNYATAFFHRPPGDHPYRTALAVPAQLTPDAVGAAFSAVEGDRWIVMMGGYGDVHPGATPEDMINRFRRDHPAPFGHVVTGELIGEVATYHQADSRRRDFWACDRLPARLIAVGDAVASFNPLYGQGMSSATLHASALSAYLRSDPDLDQPARDFYARQRVIVDAAWDISTANDRARQINNKTPARVRLAAWLADQVVAASVTDPRVNKAFQHVTQMMDHPSTLADPRVLVRALRARGNQLPPPVPPLDA